MQTANITGRYDLLVAIACRLRNLFSRYQLPAAWIDPGIALLCILPLLLTAHLPLDDVPNHLARQYILRDWAQSPTLHEYYYIHWALVPNLAMELFFLSVRWVLPLDFAMRLFCILAVLLLFLGTRSVNRLLSEGTSRTYRAVPLLCWGGPMQYGFINYCFGIGLALLLFGAWLRLRSHSLAARIPFLLAAGTGLMLCHLAAFALFAVAVGINELADRDRFVRIVPPVACLTAVFVTFTLLGPTIGIATSTPMRFSTVIEKIRSFAAITFFTAPTLEGALLAATLIGLLAALLTRTLRWHPVGFTITAVMTLIWLVTPSYAMGTLFIDYRLPWAISFFAVAALLPGEPRWATLCAVWFSILVVARIALIAVLWLRWEPILSGIDQALNRLPEGAKLMVVLGELGPSRAFRNPDLTNVAAYAVEHRHAFYPGMFASIPGQILFFTPHFRDLWQQGGYNSQYPSSLDSLPPDYDYVLVLVPHLAHIAPSLPLTLEASGQYYEIRKVKRPKSVEPG
jgi:hypothetical protein